MSADTLQEAYRLIRTGKKKEAVRLLLPLARAEPQNADAWWLLANALEDPEKQRRAVERVLKLRPDDARAQKLYDRVKPIIDDPFEGVDFESVDFENVDFDDPNATVTPPEAATPFDGEFPPDAYAAADPVGAAARAPARAAAAVPDESPESDFNDVYPPVDAYEPFDDVPQERVRVRRSSRGASPITLVLAAIGLITVVSCGLCAVALLVSAPTIQRVAGDFMQTVTYVPEFATLANLATSAPNSSSGALTDAFPSSVTQRGSVQLGQTVSATVDTFTDDAWTLAGDANQRLILTLNATDNALDPQLYLYDSDNREIAANDDVDLANNRNSRIEITLPHSGSYTIIVSAFGTGGSYELTVSAG